MAIVRPVESLADVNMVDVTWVIFVPRPSAMSTAPSTERCNRHRATVVDQDLIVAPLEQTAAYAGEQIPWDLDICTWAYA